MGRLLEELYDPQAAMANGLAYTLHEYMPRPPLARKKRPKAQEPPTHVVIGDLQVKPGVDTRNIDWIGSFIADEFDGHENVTIVCLGDFWDMPSLSSYDRGKREMESRRFIADVDAGNEAFARLDAYLPKKKSWRYVFLFGNHEDRIERAASDNAQLEGFLSLALLDTKRWERHDFREVVWIDGVAYSHYFYNRMNGRPYGGQNIETRLKTVGHSFTMGHQQGLMYGMRATAVGMQHGLVLGSSYLHDEDYLGPQANQHYRGIVCCRQVEAGDHDPQAISLDYLARRYEGIRLTEYLEKTRV